MKCTDILNSFCLLQYVKDIINNRVPGNKRRIKQNKRCMSSLDWTLGGAERCLAYEAEGTLNHAGFNGGP